MIFKFVFGYLFLRLGKTIGKRYGPIVGMIPREILLESESELASARFSNSFTFKIISFASNKNSLPREVTITFLLFLSNISKFILCSRFFIALLREDIETLHSSDALLKLRCLDTAIAYLISLRVTFIL